MYLDKRHIHLSKVIVFPQPWGVKRLEASAQFNYEDFDSNEFISFPIDVTGMDLYGLDIQNTLIELALLKYSCDLVKETIYTNWWGRGDYIHNV